MAKCGIHLNTEQMVIRYSDGLYNFLLPLSYATMGNSNFLFGIHPNTEQVVACYSNSRTILNLIILFNTHLNNETLRIQMGLNK